MWRARVYKTWPYRLVGPFLSVASICWLDVDEMAPATRHSGHRCSSLRGACLVGGTAHVLLPRPLIYSSLTSHQPGLFDSAPTTQSGGTNKDQAVRWLIGYLADQTAYRDTREFYSQQTILPVCPRRIVCFRWPAPAAIMQPRRVRAVRCGASKFAGRSNTVSHPAIHPRVLPSTRPAVSQPPSTQVGIRREMVDKLGAPSPPPFATG